MSQVAIDYDLGHHGWSSFTLTVGEKATTIGPAGYCTDVLGDLVRAALSMATTSTQVRVSFDAEPFEWRLLLTRGSWANDAWSHVTIQVLTFPDVYADAPDAAGRLEFEATCLVDAFALGVADAAERIWSEHGEEGYSEAWNGYAGFPLRALRALQAALATTEPPSPMLTRADDVAVLIARRSDA